MVTDQLDDDVGPVSPGGNLFVDQSAMLTAG